MKLSEGRTTQMPHHIVKRSRAKRFCVRTACVTVFPLALLLTLAFAGNAMAATAVPMGNAATFGALSATAMTNAGGNTVVNGNIGSSTSIDPGVTNGSGSKYGAGSPELANAQASLLIAYLNAAAATPDHPTITGANLAGQTLTPGVYNSTSSILISGPTALTLDGNGDPNSVFIFQAGSDLTVTPTSSVALTNGAQACNIFWQVGSSAILQNTGNVFTGTILALTQITLTDSITVNGRVLARNADVTFIHDTVNTPSCAGGAFPPGTHRGLYCSPTGQAYNLFLGEDQVAPYNTLGLVPGYTDPVTGSVSCVFPQATPTPVTPTPTAPTPTTPTPTPGQTPAQKKAAAAKAAAATKAAAARRAATAKRLAAVRAARASRIGSSRLAVREVGLTG
jgi:hypothetical protein